MKKISIILSMLLAAYVATSCVEPYEMDPNVLTLSNYDLTLPKTSSKKDLNGENVCYIHIATTGPWEATLETQKEGEIWCWLNDFYREAKKDENGNTMKDEFGNTIVEKVYVAEGVEIFVGGADGADGSDIQYCKVRGNGVTFLPLEYMDNNGSTVRYATVVVRRTDIDVKRVMEIQQSK